MRQSANKRPEAPTGNLEIALRHAAKLLAHSPALAVEQAREILAIVPNSPQALLILGMAQRRLNDAVTSVATLRTAASLAPLWAPAAIELGHSLAALGDGAAALASLRRAVTLDPENSDAWRAFADLLALAGDASGADRARDEQIRRSVRHPALMEAAESLCSGRLAIAERQLKSFLRENPTDVVALRMLAELASRIGRYEDSEELLRRCLELAPGFTAARHNLALVLQRQNKAAESLAQLEPLLREEPQNPHYLLLQAAAEVQIGHYQQAILLYDRVLRDYPGQAKPWMSYGHALKTEGRSADSIRAYRHSIALDPNLGEAYWSLANLKTYRFDAADITAMREALAKPDLGADDRLHFEFALGKALEDEGSYEESFCHYAEGNRQRRTQIPYDAAETSARVDRVETLFSAEFFAARAGQGCPDADPIFVVGLPRSGSTLVEQILASHSAVEGTMELPDLPAMVKILGGRQRPSAYPEMLGGLAAERLAELGRDYLARTRIQRKAGRPFFIDKMPNNFLHVGLIQLILPNAKIIDTRRHPMATCFSAFKQHFARGQAFSYDLTDVGRYYADYVRLMRHFDRVLPGRVHRVSYERMVADTEGEIRRLLDYCGLPFEEACLNFWQSRRSVRTASAEQVRRPIFHDGLEQWRHFEPWLEPLKQALGDIPDDF